MCTNVKIAKDKCSTEIMEGRRGYLCPDNVGRYCVSPHEAHTAAWLKVEERCGMVL